MATLRQIEAARRNGALSRGPVTPEGKQRSSQNALRHGLAAQSLVLSTEDRPRFDSMLAAYTERFQPADPVEADLVLSLVAAKWQEMRAWSMETALFDLEMIKMAPDIEKAYDSIDNPTRTALAFASLATSSPSLGTLTRYQIAHRRAYHRALHDLLTLQRERRQSEADAEEQAAAEREPAARTAPAPAASPTELNLAPQPAPTPMRVQNEPPVAQPQSNQPLTPAGGRTA